jgi:hypothetical protein
MAEAPPTTVPGLTVSEVSAGKLGYNVSACDSVTPPPDTKMFTTVASVTAAVVMSKKPTPLPAKTVTTLGTAARAGLLLVTCMIWSKPRPAVVVTTP